MNTRNITLHHESSQLAVRKYRKPHRVTHTHPNPLFHSQLSPYYLQTFPKDSRFDCRTAGRKGPELTLSLTRIPRTGVLTGVLLRLNQPRNQRTTKQTNGTPDEQSNETNRGSNEQTHKPPTQRNPTPNPTPKTNPNPNDQPNPKKQIKI